MDELAAARRSWGKVNEWTARHEADLVAAYGKARSVEVVAEAVGRNPEGVRRILRKHGVQLRGRGRPRGQTSG